MITINSEKGLVLVNNWSDIETRPGFLKNLNPRDHKLKSIIGRYVFEQKIRCGLSDCHTPHHKGYIAVTEDGFETNIGKDCGKTYFGVLFEQLSSTFDRDLRAFEDRETLNSFRFSLDDLEALITSLRQSEHGADWVFRNVQRLFSAGRGCPPEVVDEIRRMVRARDAVVRRQRPATEAEIQLLEAAEGRRVPRPHYFEEIAGRLAGIEALYPENDLRELLVIQVEEVLREFRDLSIPDLSGRELRRWVKWSQSVEGILERAEAAVRFGRHLLTAENLSALSRFVSLSEEFAFAGFLASLEN